MTQNARFARMEELLIAIAERDLRQPPPPPPFQIPIHVPAPIPREDWLQRTRSHSPPTFLGTEDPLALEYWVREFEKIFEASECPPEKRVKVVAYFLKGHADEWWRSQQAPDAPIETWEHMLQKMRARFCSTSVRMGLYDRFMALRQGSSTVEHYYLEFTDLIRFAPEVGASEEMKMHRFEMGLNARIQELISSSSFYTLFDMFEKATKVARAIQVRANDTSASKRKLEVPDNDRKVQPRSGGQGSHYQSSQGGSWGGGGQGQTRPYQCKRCGRNHPGKNCEGQLVQCYNCGEYGHRTFECFQARRDGVQGMKVQPSGPVSYQQQSVQKPPQHANNSQGRDSKGKAPAYRSSQLNNIVGHGSDNGGTNKDSVIGSIPLISQSEADAQTRGLENPPTCM